MEHPLLAGRRPCGLDKEVPQQRGALFRDPALAAFPGTLADRRAQPDIAGHVLRRREPRHGTEIGDQRRGRLDSDPGDGEEAAHPDIPLGAVAKLPIELLNLPVQLSLQGKAVLAHELKAALQR